MLTSGNTMLKPALISADTCTWTNQSWVLRLPTNHSSPGHNTHPLDQSETSIVVKWPITAHLRRLLRLRLRLWRRPLYEEELGQEVNECFPDPWRHLVRGRRAEVDVEDTWRQHTLGQDGVTASYAPIVTTTLSVTRIMVNSRYWKSKYMMMHAKSIWHRRKNIFMEGNLIKILVG